MRASYIFTSESVSEGHPDKVADQISDAVVDLLLATDPEARVACETMVTTQKIILSGEIRSSDRALIDEHGVLTQEGRARIEQAARETVQRIGYEQTGFHWKTAEYQNNPHAQYAHAAQGGDETGTNEDADGDPGTTLSNNATQ